MNDRLHHSLLVDAHANLDAVAAADEPAAAVLRRLGQHTAARIALGRVGISMPTAEVLRFGLSHARARDAVQLPLDTALLVSELQAQSLRVIQASSQATDRHAYLLRPDLGRRLSRDSAAHLANDCKPADIVLVVADGLSSVAVQRHALPVITRLRDALGDLWADVPVVMVGQGRVAVGDEVGEALKARLVVVMVGERPGLSSPDSLGIYMPYAPRRGLADNARNCISNVRPEGLGYEAAVLKLAYLMRSALRLGNSGVQLKEDSDRLLVDVPG